MLTGRRGVATMVTIRATELDDLQSELHATIADRRDHAQARLEAVRAALVNLGRGWSVAELLADMEREAVRDLNQATSALAHLRADAICPDGAYTRNDGHGAAA